jgi:opacity protein-like surface antigen
MRNLKLLLLFSGCILLFSESFGQTVTLRGGLNLSNMAVDIPSELDGVDIDPKTRLTYQVGALADFPVADNFYIETGILFSSKGFRVSEQESFLGMTVNFDMSTVINYVDIPLSAKTVFEVGDMHIYGSLGPYIGIGLNGKMKYEVSAFGQTERDEEKLDFEDDLERIDYGLMIGAGVEFQNIVLGLSYGLGLRNVSKWEDSSLKNRVFSISLGYRIGDR